MSTHPPSATLVNSDERTGSRVRERVNPSPVPGRDPARSGRREPPCTKRDRRALGPLRVGKSTLLAHHRRRIAPPRTRSLPTPLNGPTLVGMVFPFLRADAVLTVQANGERADKHRVPEADDVAALDASTYRPGLVRVPYPMNSPRDAPSRVDSARLLSTAGGC